MIARPERAAYALSPLARFWGGKMVAAVTGGQCRDYAVWRTAQTVAAFKDQETGPHIQPSTARRELVVLAAALNYAYREGKLKFPVPVALPARAPARTRWLTRPEAARLLWAAWRSRNCHVARFILVALYTGSRAEAVLRLRWLPSVDAGWVDLEQGLIYRKGASESETSKRRPPVPISPRLAAHLRRWKVIGHSPCSLQHREAPENGAEERPSPDYHRQEELPKCADTSARDASLSSIHVISYGGQPVAKMRRAWHSARLAAGLGPDVVPHCLRHTFASWAVQAGHSFAKVAAALGTTEKVAEEVYGHLNPDRLRDVVASVAGKR